MQENLFKKHFNIDKPLKMVCLIVLFLCIVSGIILLMVGEFWFSLEILVWVLPAFIWLLCYSPAT